MSENFYMNTLNTEDPETLMNCEVPQSNLVFYAAAKFKNLQLMVFELFLLTFSGVSLTFSGGG